MAEVKKAVPSHSEFVFPDVSKVARSVEPFKRYAKLLKELYGLGEQIKPSSSVNPEIIRTDVSLFSVQDNAHTLTFINVGLRSYANYLDGIEFYTSKPSLGERTNIAVVMEVAGEAHNTVFQAYPGLSIRPQFLQTYIEVVNKLVLAPFNHKYEIKQLGDGAQSLAIILPSKEWVPFKAYCDRISIQPYTYVVDSHVLPARMGKSRGAKWNTNYITPTPVQHSSPPVSKLSMVEIDTDIPSVEAEFNPDSNIE